MRSKLLYRSRKRVRKLINPNINKYSKKKDKIAFLFIMIFVIE